MKITLEFADDNQEARDALDAPHFRAALEDLYTYLRGATKYADPPPGAVEIRAKFHEILEEHNVDLLV